MLPMVNFKALKIEQPSTDVGGCDKLSYSIRMLKKLTQDLLSRSAEESK